MFQVPDYTLVEIFSYLTKKELMKISYVSKRWHRLSFDRYLWQEITVNEFSPINIEDYMIMKLLERSKGITKLSLRGCYQVSNKVLKNVSLCGSRLDHLNLENCFKITDRGIMMIARHCSNLKIVNVLNTVITESGLCYLIKESPNMKDLTASPSAVTEKTIETLARNCKQLETLHAEHNEYTPPVTHRLKKQEHSEILTSRMIESLAMNCRLLQVLIMKYDVTYISEWSITVLGFYCKHLECIEIGHIQHTIPLSDAGVANLCSDLTMLQRLDLTETYITDITLCTIAKNCSSLEHLSIGNTGPISDIGIQHIMRGCPNLDSFCIQPGIHSFITDLSIFAIAQAVCSHNLIKLSLKYWDISDFGLYVLARNLPNLMYLSLEGCTQLTHTGLKDALQYLKNLQSLDLSFTKCVNTDDELFELSQELVSTFQSIILETGNGISMVGCHKFQVKLPDCEVIFRR